MEARIWLLEPLNFSIPPGFGFIAPETGDKDVFVHISAVQNAGMDSLVEGQRVSFDVVTERGKQAAGNLKARLICAPGSRLAAPVEKSVAGTSNEAVSHLNIAV